MMILYRLSLFIYRLAIAIASIWNEKARRWMALRKKQKQSLEESIPKPGRNFRIWMHVASMGEFEQGRPLLEQLKAAHPDISIWVSFFSPSGYDRVNEVFIDRKLVLPLDSPGQARSFLGRVAPDLVIFVKYEFWFYFLKEAIKQGIPVLFISAILRKKHWFFHPLFSQMKNTLKQVDHFFVQDEASAQILARHGITQVTISGDTRIDRVTALPNSDADFSAIEEILPTPVDIVCGSIWPSDAAIILPVLKSRGISGIIAPHEISTSFNRDLKRALGKHCLLYSELEHFDATRDTMPRILILDTIGLLSRIYRLGKCAYIGGGFGQGIHNTLEPAAYGIPVIFGPNYGKFPEAVAFIRSGAGMSVKNKDDFRKALDHFGQPERQKQVKQKLGDFFEKNAGGTKKVFDYIEQQFL